MRGKVALTEKFAAIDSFDVSESRGEVVFSAKRKDKDNFDIGLVSTDKSPISWVPADPLDEVNVKWAPKGNKISYIVRGKGGDFIRTVHIPTAFQLGIDFPFAKILSIRWDPDGERFAVAYSTPDASERVEKMKYGGEERKMAVPPVSKLDVSVESFAKDAIVVRPQDMKYGEKLPLVVWIDSEPFAWSETRAKSMRRERAAFVITKREPTDELRKAIRETPWIDQTRTRTMICRVHCQ